MKTHIGLALVLVASIPALAVAQSMSPYAGQESRAVKTLSADETQAYLTGEGLGMAKAGELNHYPGPKHVLAMAERLALTDDQKLRMKAITGVMTAAAVPLGREIVDAEGALDRDFANGTIDDAKLRIATQHIAAIQGRLRAVHLSAHLATRKVLTVNQVTIYDRIRGYGSDSNAPTHQHGS
jgi:Spy/CpxP family protein refolding chaperone